MRKFHFLLLPLLFALAACSGGSGSAGHPEGTIVVVGREMKYQSDSVEVKAGEPVTLVFENDGALEHGLVIDDMGVEIVHVMPGHSGTATFTPGKPGAYTFYCDVPGHREAQMVGTLIVNP